MVEVIYLEDKPYILAALGVKISQSPFEKGVEELYDECKANEAESKRLVNDIVKKHGHNILLDFLPYAVLFDEISRFGAIYSWRNVNVPNLCYGAGIEASLRVVKPTRYNQVVKDLGSKAFEIYNEALENGVVEQDARYVLPEGTLTRMIFSAPPRYLGKLANSFINKPLQELREIGEELKAIINEKFGLEIQENLPSTWEFWGEREIKEGISIAYGGNPYSISLDMGLKGSLAMYAQLVRQRQLLCNLEPLESIARKGNFVVPTSFPDTIRKRYEEIASQAYEMQIELINRHDPNFVYFLLLGQEASSMIYGKGYGVIETSKARSEGVAQWEIRNKVGIPLTKELAKYSELKNEIGPRCWREKRCIEPKTFKEKKAVCKSFKVSGGKWYGSLEELLELLKEPYETFTVRTN